MTKTFRFLLVLIGVLLFASGLFLGQQTKRSRFEKYLRPGSITPMEIAVLKANIEVVRSMISDAPKIYYDSSCACFLARVTITSDWTKEPIDKVRARFMQVAGTALFALFAESPDNGPISERDVKVTFIELNGKNPETSHVVAEYVNGNIIFK